MGEVAVVLNIWPNGEKLDVGFPDVKPVAELIPKLLEAIRSDSLGIASVDNLRWELGWRTKEDAIPRDSTLSEAGIKEGDTLVIKVRLLH